MGNEPRAVYVVFFLTAHCPKPTVFPHAMAKNLGFNVDYM